MIKSDWLAKKQNYSVYKSSIESLEEAKQVYNNCVQRGLNACIVKYPKSYKTRGLGYSYWVWTKVKKKKVK